MRLSAPTYEPPEFGETPQHARARRARNRTARYDYEVFVGQRCSLCGQTRSNVVHNVDPEDQFEGPDYYADMVLHEFAA